MSVWEWVKLAGVSLLLSLVTVTPLAALFWFF
jgi:hypothetical protein